MGYTHVIFHKKNRNFRYIWLYHHSAVERGARDILPSDVVLTDPLSFPLSLSLSGGSRTSIFASLSHCLMQVINWFPYQSLSTAEWWYSHMYQKFLFFSWKITCASPIATTISSMDRSVSHKNALAKDLINILHYFNHIIIDLLFLLLLLSPLPLSSSWRWWGLRS